ncbi:MAG: DUF1844 domain-containing protein [Candidatus Zixiibacteriota bacterium]|nr:MAG: DUF1844 domain-containing protein [candidate division Zixibacteria bacterium]
MTDQAAKIDPHLMQLVLSLHAGAMQQLGKIVSPVSGEIERDLELARYTIDILGMLETKTKGNLSDEESRLLARTLSELRLNYVDESKKGDSSPTEETTPQPDSGEDSPPPEEGNRLNKED